MDGAPGRAGGLHRGRGAPAGQGGEVTTHGRDQSRCPRLRLSHAPFIQPGGNWHGRSHGSSTCLGYK